MGPFKLWDGQLYKISFFVPDDHAEVVKLAMFQAGAGRIGHYEHCSFETSGIGQFKAMEGAKPYLGSVGELFKVNELKVEMVCEEKKLIGAIEAMKKNHPYETPAYDIIKLVEI